MAKSFASNLFDGHTAALAFHKLTAANDDAVLARSCVLTSLTRHSPALTKDMKNFPSDK